MRAGSALSNTCDPTTWRLLLLSLFTGRTKKRVSFLIVSVK